MEEYGMLSFWEGPESNPPGRVPPGPNIKKQFKNLSFHPSLLSAEAGLLVIPRSNQTHGPSQPAGATNLPTLRSRECCVWDKPTLNSPLSCLPLPGNRPQPMEVRGRQAWHILVFMMLEHHFTYLCSGETWYSLTQRKHSNLTRRIVLERSELKRKIRREGTKKKNNTMEATMKRRRGAECTAQGKQVCALVMYKHVM